jgi:hypothetical protein
MTLEIRLLRNDEHNSVIDFFNNAQSIDHKEQKDFRTPEIFDWEFCKGPWGKAIYVVAVDNTDAKNPKIIGTQCAIPISMITNDGKEILTGKSEDVYVDIRGMRSFKGRDILKEIHELLVAECAKAGMRYLWGITNIVATHHRLGFEMVAKSHQGILVLKPAFAYRYLIQLNSRNTWKEKLKIRALSYLSKISGMKRLFVSGQLAKYQIVDRIFDNAELMQTISTNGEKYLMLRQNSDYLNWRMFGNPAGIQYKIRQLVADEKLYGEIVYSQRNGIAFIEQMLFDAKLTGKEKYAFIKSIINEITLAEAPIIRFTGYNHTAINRLEMNLLKSLGFMFVPRGIWFAVKPVGQPENDNQTHQFHLTRLYTQGII